MLKVIGQGVPDPVAPANDAAAPQDVLEVLTAHAMRLSAQTRVTMARQRPDGMFHGLAKRRADFLSSARRCVWLGVCDRVANHPRPFLPPESRLILRWRRIAHQHGKGPHINRLVGLATG